jgi:hypothetical protein
LEYLDLNLQIYKVLLAARGAFDRARDVTSQRAAKKLITEEMLGGVGYGGSPKITAAETVGTQELINRYKSPLNVPQVPRGFIQR